MLKWMRIGAALLGGLLLAGSLAACTPSDDEPTPPVDEQPPVEDTTDTPPEEEEPEVKYVYDPAEYEAPLTLFGEWSEYFVKSQRANRYATTVSTQDGLYVQSRGEVKTEGVRTYASVDRAYNAAMHVNVDAYIVNPSDAKAYIKAGYEIIGSSGSFNKTTYSDEHPEVLQRNADGSTGGLWGSSVLVRDVVEYNLGAYLKAMTASSNWSVGFVEPEMFRAGQYGDAYKELWEIKYGEAWSDPLTTVRSIFLSQRLNVWTHTNAIKMYASYVNANETVEHKYSVAPHSTLAYTTYTGGITDGYVHMMGTGQVETVTGQTWSNTIINHVRYQGKSERRTFINAYMEYGTYLDAVNYYDTDFYALCDPMSDTYTSEPESYWRQLCHEQLVASMMYSDINRWELIWTNRSFMNVSSEYRSEQLNIHNALLEISGAPYRATAGTPGITYLLGDTLSWQTNNTRFSESSYDGFWGVAAPLVYDGIPLRTMAMELITEPTDLNGVSVLIVSYDNQKPLYEETNKAVAEWVKAGGTLLYLGGPDSYVNIEDAWWNESGKGGSPTANLLMHLGLDGQITAKTLSGGAKGLKWLGGATDADAPDYKDGAIKAGDDAYTYYYEGSGFETLLASEDGKSVGISYAAGKGHVIMVGLSTTDYSDSAAAADLMRMLVAKATETTDYSYVTSDAFVVERGDYTAVYPLQGNYTLKGTYVNIFSSDLTLVVNPVVKEGEAALYLRVADQSALTQPTVMYAGGFVQEIKEEANKTEITLYAAENALIPIRVAAPAGMVATEVTVRYGDGTTTKTAHLWDSKTNSIVVTPISTPTTPATVSITWVKGGTPVKNTTYKSFVISTNAKGTDAEYIISNSAQANDSMRYCEKSGILIWKFDISEYEGLVVSAAVVQNYILEISGDNDDYDRVADYSKISMTRATGTNDAVVTILTDAYTAVSDTLYVRLRNTNPSLDWGGAIRSFTFRYIVEE